MPKIRTEAVVQGKTISFETGHLAKQAAGSVLVQCGETIVLVTANVAPAAREGMDFFPLTCEFRPRFYASGRIPGSFFKREGRPGELGILVCRLMDRPTRPLFPKHFKNETQLYAMTISHDQQECDDILAMLGSSAALHLSPAPFQGPHASIRVGYIDGEFIANPTIQQLEESELNMVVTATADSISMVEAEAEGVSEQVVLDALDFAAEAVKPLLDAQNKLRELAGKEKWPSEAPSEDESLLGRVHEIAAPHFRAAFDIRGKHLQSAALSEVPGKVLAELADLDEDQQATAKKLLRKVEKTVLRNMLLDDDLRCDGRSPKQIRQITSEVGMLPKAHGSAVFTRGETQALVAVTLGTRESEQRMDTLTGSYFNRFMLHYNFPSFSVGEVRRIMGPGRREIGHGYLARRAVEPSVPEHDDFPYTVRIVSDTLESNGSSSMAAVCGSSLALMDAGVPVKNMVAGIAMGLVKEGDRYAVLSDISGTEDHLGDMDFKVAGTADGINALQMDNKVGGITRAILQEALTQAHEGRNHILGEMAKAISEPRSELNANAPRIVTIKIHRDRIRDVIGPGGKTIRGICESTGATVNVEDDGTVRIASADADAMARAIRMVEQLTQEAEVGKLYLGMVRKVTDFGAFVEIFPGTDGLVHISQLAHERVDRVTDVVNEGEEVLVKCIEVDSKSGKIRLSRKDALGVGLEGL